MHKTYSLLGVLGGTFDPIHNGHIAIADHILQTCCMERMEFIPCNQSPHREQPIASPLHRFLMTQLATHHHPAFHVNAIEITRGGISYTVDTVKALSNDYPEHAICLLMGADAFSKFHLWHEWKTILDYAHIIVISREHVLPNEAVLTALLQARQVTDKNQLQLQRAGFIYCETIPPIAISATRIRKEIEKGAVDIVGLSSEVCAYINNNQLYEGSRR